MTRRGIEWMREHYRRLGQAPQDSKPCETEKPSLVAKPRHCDTNSTFDLDQNLRSELTVVIEANGRFFQTA
jgi:hypothetical protein